MAKFVNNSDRNKDKKPSAATQTQAAVEEPVAPPQSPTSTTEPPRDIDAIMQSQAMIHQHDPNTSMQFPETQEREDKDAPSSKDPLIHAHQFRLGGKRRFLMDALSRALEADFFLLDADKAWAPNPLGTGGNVTIRYSREFPSKFVLYDKYDVVPKPEIIAYKRKLANANGYKYIYETPEFVLNHEQLHKQLDQQKDVAPPTYTA